MAAVGIAALVLRTAYLLSNDPLREVDLELVYLRLGDMRRAGLLVLTVVLLEVYEFLYPKLTVATRIRHFPAWAEAVNAIQALLLLAAVGLVFLRVREYTGPGQARHAEATLADLAESRGPRAPATEVEESEAGETG